jgi:succinate dehydrogenase/fumarate reductase cytochrome b subunit
MFFNYYNERGYKYVNPSSIGVRLLRLWRSRVMEYKSTCTFSDNVLSFRIYILIACHVTFHFLLYNVFKLMTVKQNWMNLILNCHWTVWIVLLIVFSCIQFETLNSIRHLFNDFNWLICTYFFPLPIYHPYHNCIVIYLTC